MIQAIKWLWPHALSFEVIGTNQSDNSPLSPCPNDRGLKNSCLLETKTDRSLSLVFVNSSPPIRGSSENAGRQRQVSCRYTGDVFMDGEVLQYHTDPGCSNQSSRFQKCPRSTRGPRGRCLGSGTCCPAEPLLAWTLCSGWGLRPAVTTTADRCVHSR